MKTIEHQSPKGEVMNKYQRSNIKRLEGNLAALREAAKAVIDRYKTYNGGCMCDVIEALRIAIEIRHE